MPERKVRCRKRNHWDGDAVNKSEHSHSGFRELKAPIKLESRNSRNVIVPPCFGYWPKHACHPGGESTSDHATSRMRNFKPYLSQEGDLQTSSEEKNDASGKIVNSNSSGSHICSTVSSTCRDKNHPDFDQKSSHWITLCFSLNLDPQKRMVMRVRKDIPLRWCSLVIANQMGILDDRIDEKVNLFYPKQDEKLDQITEVGALNLPENAVIYVKTLV
ncbi:hypothetical protein CSKR_106447 [Clonorchis sinensis]|uniref:Uncharacterized protein n=1 Tax=Clonorchis sinensis TaxID=79923 RepID=A0A3R7C344_CLOSI|nr:hypothetical protein CSKR_106447 [Clonorchis sinensis]